MLQLAGLDDEADDGVSSTHVRDLRAAATVPRLAPRFRFSTSLNFIGLETDMALAATAAPDELGDVEVVAATADTKDAESSRSTGTILSGLPTTNGVAAATTKVPEGLSVVAVGVAYNEEEAAPFVEGQ